jgi:hypothetical protein
MTHPDETTPGMPQSCPICGQGTLVDVSFNASSRAVPDERIQEADTSQVVTYSCGHEVGGPRLDETAVTGELEVEHRTSEDATPGE